MNDYKKIVVAFDFSPHSDTALWTAADLALRLGAHLEVLHIIQEPHNAYPPIEFGGFASPAIPIPIRDTARAALRERIEEFRSSQPSVSSHVVEAPSVDRAIVDFAENAGADLIVMGTHGRSGLAQTFLGSVAVRTLRQARCPVLTVQANSEEDVAKRDALEDAASLASRRRENEAPVIVGAQLQTPAPTPRPTDLDDELGSVRD